MTKLLQAIRVASVVILLVLVAAGQTHLTNILTNGDFSKGLSCYNETAVGSPNYGPWLFYLSTDIDLTKAGGYSAEIYCPGPTGNCSSAHIATERIPVDSGKSYKLVTTYKCGSNTTADIDVYSNGMYWMTQPQALVCNGMWNSTAANPFIFSPPAGFMALLFNDQQGTDYLKVDNVKLTYSDGTVPDQTVNFAGYPRRAVVPQGSSVVEVDGEPYFAMGFYDVPGSVAAFQSAQMDGANTVVTAAAPVIPIDKCFNTGQTAQLDYRDWAYQHHLNLLPNSIFSVRTGYDDGTKQPNGTGAEHVMSSMVSTYGTHLANIGWTLADEPDITDPYFNVMGSELTTLYGIATNAIENLNMSLPLFTSFNHPTWDPNFINLGYGGSTAIWGAEPYGYSQWVEEIDNATGAFANILLQPTRPIWLAFDGGLENGLYHPNIMVAQAYYAIIKGATGILYFDWGEFNQLNQPGCPLSDSLCLVDNAKQVFNELAALSSDYPDGGPLLAGAHLTVTSTVPVIGRSYQAQNYAVAVNQTETSLGPTTFYVNNLLNDTTITVMFENGRTFQSGAGSFTDPQGFGPLSRHVYQWPQ